MDRILRTLLDSEEVSDAERKRLFKSLALRNDTTFQSTSEPTDESSTKPVQATPASNTRQRPKKRPKRPPKTQGEWIPPGQPVTIHDITIPGGMIYLGERLKSPGYPVEPALIDPTLPIIDEQPSRTGYGYGYGWSGYQQGYAHGTPKQRATYLEWLAGDRRGNPIDHHSVLLFLAGLERRVLVDIRDDSSLAPELLLIRDEVQALHSVYGEMWSVGDASLRLLDLIDTISLGFGQLVPFHLERRNYYHQPPMALERLLAISARDEEPIPWEVALAWAVYRPNPSMNYRLPKFEACPDEFARLFELRYRQLAPDGIRPRRGKSVKKLSYRRMTETYYGKQHLICEIQDVFSRSGQHRRLSEVYGAVAKELAPFAKAIGELRTNVSRLVAFGSLPPDLIDGYSPETDAARAIAEQAMGKKRIASVPGAAFIDIWPVTTPGRISLPQARSLAIVLETFGFGMEPDPDSVGQAPVANEPIILFRDIDSDPALLNRSYKQSQVLAQIAIAVTQADGALSDDQLDTIATQAGAIYGNRPELALRLCAYARWINRKPAKLLPSLNNRLREAWLHDREETGQELVSIVTAVRQLSPKTITALSKAYRLIEIDPDLVTSHLHALLTREPARNPVTIRAATPNDERDFTIPAPPLHRRGKGSSRPEQRVTLDQAKISTKIEQSQEIATLLGELFTDEEDRPASAISAPTGGGTIGSLDATHTALLLELGAHQPWTRAAFDALASMHHLLPEGAIDTLNEVALDAFGEPLLEGSDPLEINLEAFEHLTRSPA